MKTTTILAIALGLGSLAACNKSPQEQTADNIEANAENTADTIEANVDNAADNDAGERRQRGRRGSQCRRQQGRRVRNGATPTATAID